MKNICGLPEGCLLFSVFLSMFPNENAAQEKKTSPQPEITLEKPKPQAGKPPSIKLSDKELVWLAEHPEIDVFILDRVAPYSFLSEAGNFEGIFPDLLDAVERRLPIRFKRQPADADAHNRIVVNGEAPVIGAASKQVLQNANWPYLATHSFAQAYVSLYGKSKPTEPFDPAQLHDATIAIVPPIITGIVDDLSKRNRLLHVANTKEGLAAVTSDKADYLLEYTEIVKFYLKKQPDLEIQVLHTFPVPDEAVIMVHKDEPMLVSIFNKAIADIAATELPRILNRWYLRSALPELNLTQAERDWLHTHRSISLGISQISKPLLIQDDAGNRAGILPEIAHLVEAATGLDIKMKLGPWHEISNLASQGKLDGLLACTPDLAKAKGLLSTKEYLFSYPVVYGRPNARYQIHDIGDLKGKRVAHAKGMRYAQSILEQLQGQATAVVAEDFMEAVALMIRGDADVILGLTVDSYVLSQKIVTGIEPLLIDTSHKIHGVMAIRTEWPELVGILNKALSYIGEAKINAITKKWTQLALPEESLTLSQQEQEWLSQHPVVRVVLDPLWAPVEFRDDAGRYQGISMDYLRRLEEQLGIRFEIAEVLSWGEGVTRVRQRRLDMVSSIVWTQQRAKALSFTSAYLSMPIKIFSRSDVSYIGDLDNLANKRVAVVEGYAVTEWLKRDYPRIQQHAVKTAIDALKMVEAGRVDAFVGNVVTGSYYIGKLHMHSVRVAGETPYRNDQAMAVRGDWSVFAGILQKALDTIEQPERDAFYNHWMSIKYEHHFDYAILWQILGLVALLLGAILYWNRKLKSAVRSQTAALRQTQEFLEAALGQSPSGILIADAPDVTIRMANPAGLGIRGGDKNMLSDIDVSQHAVRWQTYHPDGSPYPPKQLPLSRAILEGVVTQDEEVIIRNENQEDRWVSTNAAPIRNAQGDIIAGIVIFHDITERKQNEAELQQYRKRLEQLVEERTQELKKLTRAVEQSPVAVVITDRQGVIEYVNPTFTSVTGYSPEEVIGQTSRLLKSGRHPPEFYVDLWETVLSGKVWSNDILNKKKNNEEFWERAAIAPIVDESGNITNIVAVKEDISKQKRLEQELVAAKEQAETANRAKSTFLANMSHEIRTPMNAVLGYSQILRQDKGVNEGQRRSLEAINRAGEHLMALIDSVLEMSKIEAGRISIDRAAFDIQALLVDLEMMFKVRTDRVGIDLIIETPAELPRTIAADEGKIRQVLINLIGNAVKFTQEGTIKVVPACIDVDESNDSLVLSIDVCDTGIGISENDREKVFGAFEQTDSGRNVGGGTGLGLAISRQYARLMGGDLVVESQEGKGSTFSFTFACREVAQTSKSKFGTQPKVVGIAGGQPPYRVLVVDDHEDNRDILVNIFQPLGFELETANDGAQGVEMFKRFAPHVVLMDIRMPVMDGVEASQTIRDLPGGNEVTIIAVSASALEEQKVAVLERGADGFVRKPFREAELFEALAAHSDVRFIYEELKTSDELSSPETGGLSTDALAGLSVDLLKQIEQATICGFKADLERLSDEIVELAPQHAAAFRALVDDFKYEHILSLVVPLIKGKETNHRRE